MNWALMGISSVLALGGIALAWLMYVKQPELPGKVAAKAQFLYQLSRDKFMRRSSSSRYTASLCSAGRSTSTSSMSS